MRYSTMLIKSLVYVLIVLGGFVSSASAEVIFSEDFSGFSEGSLSSPTTTRVSVSGTIPTLDECTQVPGWAGNRIYQAGGAVKLGASTEIGYISTPFIDLSASGGKFYLSFKAMVASPGDETVIYIHTNNGTGNVLVTDIHIQPYSSDLIFHEVGPLDITADLGTNTAVRIRISGANTYGRLILDDLVISEVEPYAKIESEIFKTEAGIKQTKNLELVAFNLEDDLEISITNTVGMAFNTGVTTITAEEAMDPAGYSIPVDYKPTDLGSHEARITVSGGGMVDDVTTTVTGTSWSAVEFSNLRDLRNAYNTEETYGTDQVFRITNEVVASYVNTNGFYKYFQDETAGILVFDTQNYANTREDTTQIGDEVIGLTGTLDEYNGILELLPVSAVTRTNTNIEIEPIDITIRDLKSYYDSYESRLVKINGLINVSGMAVWDPNSFNSNYDFAKGTDTIVIRTQFMTDYWGTPIPVGEISIVGIVLQNNGLVRLFPRNADDLKISTGIIANTVRKPVIFGSNGVLHVETSPGQLIEVYDISGRKIISKVASEEISNFILKKNQIYIVKTGVAVSKVIL